MNVDGLPMDIISPAQGEVDHTCGYRGIGITINQDEGTRMPIVLIRIECQRMIQREIADTDVIEFQGFRGHMF